jgi:hypothetical protein
MLVISRPGGPGSGTGLFVLVDWLAVVVCVAPRKNLDAWATTLEGGLHKWLFVERHCGGGVFSLGHIVGEKQAAGLLVLAVSPKWRLHDRVLEACFGGRGEPWYSGMAQK